MTGSNAVFMIWFALALLGSLTLAGFFAARAKQALIEDAQALTDGYF